MKIYINEQELSYLHHWEISNDPIDITPLSTTKVDPNWWVVDSNGHYHASSEDETMVLPTLNRVHVEEERIDSDAGYDEPEQWTETRITWHCRICNEIVVPKWIVSTPIHRVLTPGRLSWRVELRARGGNCQALQELDGQDVSVKIVDEEGIMFGVGLLKELATTVAIRKDEQRWFGVVYGNGALGIRKV